MRRDVLLEFVFEYSGAHATDPVDASEMICRSPGSILSVENCIRALVPFLPCFQQGGVCRCSARDNFEVIFRFENDFGIFAPCVPVWR
jgi:hypothetical protein